MSLHAVDPVIVYVADRRPPGGLELPYYAREDELRELLDAIGLRRRLPDWTDYFVDERRQLVHPDQPVVTFFVGAYGSRAHETQGALN